MSEGGGNWRIDNAGSSTPEDALCKLICDRTGRYIPPEMLKKVLMAEFVKFSVLAHAIHEGAP